MKKIYTITLDDENVPSWKFYNDLRVIAYWLYDALDGMESKDGDSILCHEGLIHNDLLETSCKGIYQYRFLSDINKGDYHMYEPFIINNNSFGFTIIDDDIISDAEITELLDQTLKFLNLNYKYSINDIYYDESHSNRIIALDRLVNCQQAEPILVRKKVNPLFTKLGLAGR